MGRVAVVLLLTVLAGFLLLAGLYYEIAREMDIADGCDHTGDPHCFDDDGVCTYCGRRMRRAR